MLMAGCQPIHQPSVCPPTVRHHFDCPSIHCHRFISQLRVYLSIPQSIHSCFSQHPSSFQPSAARLSPRPSICLSVRLPTLSCFFQRLSITISAAGLGLSFQPPAACLSVCLSVYLSMDGSEARYSPTLTDW